MGDLDDSDQVNGRAGAGREGGAPGGVPDEYPSDAAERRDEDAARNGQDEPASGEAEAPSSEAKQSSLEDEAGPLGPPTPEELAGLRRKAAERDEYLELAKRAKADFVNYRKRMEQERAKWAAIAQRDVLGRLLTACDQCSVAAKSAADDCSVESLRNAIRLVWSELERFLKEMGVSQVSTVGAKFDPNVHQAVLARPSSEYPDSTVLDEVKPGYAFGDHVLRPAQVVVAKSLPVESGDAEGEKGEPGLESRASADDNGG